ncbi:MAG TPA: DUF2306 domain-containing protein [Pyrinomonadaceae bacterium]|jgi:uncharacterized membrane protein|nr:DUF2306 domain-containing protein [Pyrinomonadaceae bacterium]
MTVRAKHVFFAAFGVMTLFVFYLYETPFLDSRSPVWQHVEPVKWLLLPHGLAGALALLLAPFQFSTRLRKRSLRLHRILGRLYVAGVAVAAPVAIPIAIILGPPSLVMAAVIQSCGWLVATAFALYCVRKGDIRQHQEWMTRSYPFAMVFVFARAILAVPAVRAMGEVAFVSVVWSLVAMACFVPSLLINWRAVFRRGTASVRRPDLTAKTTRAVV